MAGMILLALVVAVVVYQGICAWDDFLVWNERRRTEATPSDTRRFVPRG